MLVPGTASYAVSFQPTEIANRGTKTVCPSDWSSLKRRDILPWSRYSCGWFESIVGFLVLVLYSVLPVVADSTGSKFSVCGHSNFTGAWCMWPFYVLIVSTRYYLRYLCTWYLVQVRAYKYLKGIIGISTGSPIAIKYWFFTIWKVNLGNMRQYKWSWDTLIHRSFQIWKIKTNKNTF